MRPNVCVSGPVMKTTMLNTYMFIRQGLFMRYLDVLEGFIGNNFHENVSARQGGYFPRIFNRKTIQVYLGI